MRALWFGLLAIVLAMASPSARGDDEPAGKAPTAQELLERLKGGGALRADDAVEALVCWRDDDFVRAALVQLKEETDFHARIALGYVLAAHGEKAGLEVLVASLEQTGHLGYVYLTRVAPEDFGWDRDGSSLPTWKKWLDGFTEEEYRERVRRERMSPAARNAGREEYEAAIEELISGAARPAVAERLRAYAKAYPQADLVPDALELADRLEEEAKEDAAWKEPATPASLSAEERAAWLVYHLRDATGIRLPFDGYTSVLPPRGTATAPPKGPVADLLAGGSSSIPVLLAMLEDRRPIRAAGWGSRRVSDRRWHSVLVVLRYQDAALEMLNAMLPTPTYERKRTADYLSSEGPEDRTELIADVRRWADDTRNRSPAELRWIGIRRSGTYDALKEIRRIAVEEKRTAEALAELRMMFEGGRHWIFQPKICEVMADLGDTSKVAAVLESLGAGTYSAQMLTVEGDSAVGINAERTARRIQQRYGKAAAPDGPGVK